MLSLQLQPANCHSPYHTMLTNTILVAEATMSAYSSWQYSVTNMSASLKVEIRLCIIKNYSTNPDLVNYGVKV